MRGKIREAVHNFRYLARVSGVGEFARRYFVMNSFDGVLTIIGIILGSYSVVGVDPKYIVSAGIGATIAMAVSGFSGTYMTETAERRLRLKFIEKQLLRKLAGSLQDKAAKFASFWSAMIDGVSPALVSFICLFPLLLSMYGILNPLLAFYTALTLSGIILFSLGLYLGRISKENVIWWGLKILLIGAFVAGISILAAKTLII